MEIILWIGFYFLTFYAFLPAFVSRVFGFRVFMRGKTKSEIALTFDDGPDPVYTPILLDLLKKHGAKATFFVVGANAEKYPELVSRMHEEGHIVGIHNYVHHSNWFMRPKTVKRQIHRTSDVIKKITGARPKYYRPPWGIVNVFDYGNIGYLQIVLWTSMFGDWRKKIGAENLYLRMRKKLKPGEVFLLHDCGITVGADRDAPANTIAALARILEDGRELGYRFVGIDEMIELTEGKKSKISTEAEGSPSVGPVKRVLVACWMLWEKLFHVTFRLKPIGDGKSFNYRVRKYSGPVVYLRDGKTLRSGDKIMEMHFENRMLYDMGMNSRSAVHTAIRLVRSVADALPFYARELESLPDRDDVKALYGVSIIHRGSDGLGFQIFDLPRGMFSWTSDLYLRFMMSIITPEGSKRVRERGTRLHPGC
ncbi:polysaccharide deacetylase family protein [Cohnella faecalis]|uniref:Polysaccharide deacetylase family protein n=1 Tax=Cohnella faecalis TaxID=2315694 RepID=A0A398CLI5_9BACL|nr:polysaccharide deacetylase family protein [Cohnella faecalis]RIE03092.1 polysaccharide deacetylase family protein [Cohnella faecalis]